MGGLWRKLPGHYAYYGIPGSHSALACTACRSPGARISRHRQGEAFAARGLVQPPVERDEPD